MLKEMLNIKILYPHIGDRKKELEGYAVKELAQELERRNLNFLLR